MALENRVGDESQMMGIQDPATDIQIRNESPGGLGGVPKKNVDGDEQQVEEDAKNQRWLKRTPR